MLNGQWGGWLCVFKLNILKKSLPNTVTKNEPDTQLHNVLFEYTVCIYNLHFNKAVCKFIILSSFSQWRCVLWCLTRILGKKGCSWESTHAASCLPRKRLSSWRQVSILSYLSLHPIHIQFHPFDFLVDFNRNTLDENVFHFVLWQHMVPLMK